MAPVVTAQHAPVDFHRRIARAGRVAMPGRADRRHTLLSRSGRLRWRCGADRSGPEPLLKRAPQLESLGNDQNVGPEITSRYLEPLHCPSLFLYDSTGPRPRTSSQESTLNSPRKKHFGGWYESAATPPWYIKVDPPGTDQRTETLWRRHCSRRLAP